MPRLSELAQLLRHLPPHDKEFSEVKKLVVNHPVLRYYDINEEITVQFDASERVLGTTLLQTRQPVVFASRTLTATEQSYLQIEKECLAIVFACEKFAQYISRRDSMTVESDHKPLQSI